MVDRSILIHQVKPTHCQGFVLALCIMQYRRQFELMLSTSRHCGHKSFLERGVKVSVGEHETQPTIPKEGWVKSLPMHGVRAIGRKCAGLEASWLAEALAISLIAATMMDWAQQRLKR